MFPPPRVVGASHRRSVHVLPVAATRTVRSRRSSAHVAHGSGQRTHCAQNRQATGTNSNTLT